MIYNTRFSIYKYYPLPPWFLFPQTLKPSQKPHNSPTSLSSLSLHLRSSLAFLSIAMAGEGDKSSILFSVHIPVPNDEISNSKSMQNSTSKRHLETEPTKDRGKQEEQEFGRDHEH